MFFKCGVGYIVLYFIQVCSIEFLLRKLGKTNKKELVVKIMKKTFCFLEGKKIKLCKPESCANKTYDTFKIA